MANSHPFQTLPGWRITATISHKFARVKRYLYDYTARNATKNRNKKYPKNSDIFVTETLQKSNLHRKPTTHQNHQKHNVVSHMKNLNAPIEWNAYSSSKTYHRQAGIFWLHQNSSRIKWKKLQNYTPVKSCKCMLWFWFDSHSVVGRQPAAAHVHHILSHISAREPTNQLVESWNKMIRVVALETN